jgi:hypothetical protein
MKSRPHALRSVIVGTVLSVICAGAIHAAVVYYRQAKAMEHAIDTLGAECRENGGCTLPAPDLSSENPIWPLPSFAIHCGGTQASHSL